ncbi:MAG: sugar phosphate isomerase/epimerase [Candidatus Izemoplasmatales bacterium]|jgi:sugar phosphate isomerase/epimerase|nr:sugar phosphate isomerase/epimerase [Candidatus Izemoplasmatales bacterium]
MMKCGLQTFTIRKEMNKDPEAAFQFIKEIGLDHVELARIDFSHQTAELIKKTGLTVMSLQATYQKLHSQFDQISTFMMQVGCQIACVSLLSFGAIIGGKRAILRYAKKLNRLAYEYAKNQIVLAFHHHDFEFRKVSGRYKLEWLIEATDPAVKFVLDTYWVTKMKEDPIQWINRLGERLIGLHLRDHRYLKNGKSTDTEIGNGTVDFKRIIASAKPHVLYGVIEQDTQNPKASIRQSVDHCHRLGLN